MQRRMQVALGEAPASLAVINGDIVNVYTGEIQPGQTILTAGDKIAYIGTHYQQSIGPETVVIDAAGKTVCPGFIDGHTHVVYPYLPEALFPHAVRNGVTAIVTELVEVIMPMGYRGAQEVLKWFAAQPIKYFTMIPPMPSISPTLQGHTITVEQMSRLFRRPDVLGLGEIYWVSPVLYQDEISLEYIAEALRMGKKVDGHGAGARNAKLQAYAGLGVTSDHEPTTAEETIERLRAGLYVFLRDGEVRRELANVIPKIKDLNLDWRRLCACTDGWGPWQIMESGYMNFIVQQLIDLGMNPITAIQMVTLNVASRFGLEDSIGGLAPGRAADIVVLPNLKQIQPECVIANGKVAYNNGEVCMLAPQTKVPRWLKNTVHLDRPVTAADFKVKYTGARATARVNVMDEVTDILTREAVVELPVVNGYIQPDTAQNVIKITAVERIFAPGMKYTGFIRGLGFKSGAIATSLVWDSNDIVCAGVNDEDIAVAINRVAELQGGTVICDKGRILAEYALPIAGLISPESVEYLAEKITEVQRAAESLGCTKPDIRVTMMVMCTGAIPFFRICESGVMDERTGKWVELVVE